MGIQIRKRFALNAGITQGIAMHIPMMIAHPTPDAGNRKRCKDTEKYSARRKHRQVRFDNRFSFGPAI